MQAAHSAGRRDDLIKQVPPTAELRALLQHHCRLWAAESANPIPLTTPQLQRQASRLLTQLQLPEAYLGWTMVVLNSELWRDAVIAVPTADRLLLLPQSAPCQASTTPHEPSSSCDGCSACGLIDFHQLAESLGYHVMSTQQPAAILEQLFSGKVQAVIGVADLDTLEKSLGALMLTGIPCMAVPLASDDSGASQVDHDWVEAMIRLPYQPSSEESTTQQSSSLPPAQTTTSAGSQSVSSYLPLLRTAAELFTSESLNRLAPRVRSQTPLTETAVTPESIAGMDPIVATEHIAFDFLARGGKHSRPFITLAAYQALAAASDSAITHSALPTTVLRAAISIETFHKASLVHDDIQDDDAYRYGQEAVHRRFGLATAINVGDYLIGLGYRLLSSTLDDAAQFSAQTRLDLLDCLASAHLRLAEGQGAELLWRDAADKNLTPDDALRIYALKTSPAFEAALFSGVHLAGDASHLRQPIRQFSRNLGIAFQILNDLDDWQANSANKVAAAGDVLGGRPTLLLALTLQQSTPQQRSELLQLLAEDCPLSDEQRIEAVRQQYQQAGAFDEARRLVASHRAAAEAVATAIEPEPLQRLFDFLIQTVLKAT